MKKVCVIGHFGFGQALFNGQTVKTKIISDELEKLYPDDVMKIDTCGGIKSLLKAPFQVLSVLRNGANIVILPAHNGVRVYAPLLSFFSRFFKGRRLHYAVIGGWLPDFLKNKKLLSYSLKRFYGIYVETDTMKRAMDGQGFENVFVMPNCKELNILNEEELVYANSEPYRLCTFSRVMKEKGIGAAINAVKRINEKYGRCVCTLDIFGQVDAGQTEWFEGLKKEFPEFVRYGGVVPFDKSVDVLKDYFALLFPTYYDGEGFAGTVLDAYAAGVPVLASDWKYNFEVVQDGNTGALFPAKDPEALIEKLGWAVENVDKWNKMKINCLAQAQKYRPENVIKVLTEGMVS